MDTRPRRRGLASAVLAAFVAAPLALVPAQAETRTPIDQNRDRAEIKIVRGTFPSDPDGAVSLYAPSYNGFSCSASRIGAKWVLTARHCAELNPTRAYTDSVTKVEGDYGNITNIYYAPNSDVALLQLDRAPSGKILQWSDQWPSRGDRLVMRGWGMDSSYGTSTNRLKSATGAFAGQGTNPFYSGYDILVNGIDGAPWKGDSGGPVTKDGVVYGALSWSSSYGNDPNAQAGYGALAPHAAWVQRTTGIAPLSGDSNGDTPEPPRNPRNPRSPRKPDTPRTPDSGQGRYVEISSSNYDSVVKESHKRPVALEFGATWCGACQYLKPRMQQAFQSGGGKWTLGHVDVDNNGSLARQWGVSAYPTVVFLWQGREISNLRFVGAKEASEVQQYASSALRYAQQNPGTDPDPQPEPEPIKDPRPEPEPTKDPEPQPDPKPSPAPEHDGPLKTLTSQNFEAFLAESKGKTVFLVFSKDGCEPCALLHPVLEAKAKALGNKTAFGIMDGTQHKDVWARYDNPWFPTIVALRDGKELGRHTGYAGDKAEIEAWMDKAMKGSASSDPLVSDVDIFGWPPVEEMSWRHPVIVAYYRSDGRCPVCEANIARLKKMVAKDGGKWTLVTVDLNNYKTYNIWTYFKVQWADTIDVYYRDELVQPRLIGWQSESQLRSYIDKTLSTHYPPKER